MIARNTIRNAGNNGIQVWRSQAGDDGTQVIDNRIEDTAAQAGGSGQNGNAINVFRAHNVTVRGNRIRNAAFSAVRGNAASNIQITNNTCTGLGEVAIYAEFGFEGAVIANNTIDGAAIGIAVTNFNEGGRLAVVQGNLIRNLVPKRARRHRSERRRRHRHRRRGRHRGDRQHHRERADRRHRGRLGTISARRQRDRQRGAQRRRRHRGVGVARRGLRGDRRQSDRGHEERRHRRDGPAQAR